MKSRSWCFTNFDMNFNYVSYYVDKKVKYMIIGREICPHTGREHDQGYVYFKNERGSLRQVARELGNAHVEMCKGSFEDNCKYCSKDNNVREFGERPQQGLRTDLIEIYESIRKGYVTVDEVTEEDPMMYHRYGRTLEKLEDIAHRKKFRNWMTECDWIYGKTGTGKSAHAFENYDPSTHFVYANDKGWWDGYKGQEIVIINEFRGQIKYHELLELIDQYPKTVKRRNREPTPFLARKIIITTPFRPEEIYSNLHINDDLGQLLRRITILEQKSLRGNTDALKQ